MSIVRGRGIDTVALRYLAAPPRPGRRGVRRRLDRQGRDRARARRRGRARRTARSATAFSTRRWPCWPTPAAACATFGTREDFLIPSACLNSTVSGLVSRTVLNPADPGARPVPRREVLPELAAADVSRAFLDAVTARFADVRADGRARLAGAARRRPRRRPGPGWAAVERLSDAVRHRRRQPGQARGRRDHPGAAAPGAVGGAGAARRRRRAARTCGCWPSSAACRCDEVDGLAYSCVGLIHPQYTRGATGADGTAALVTDAGRHRPGPDPDLLRAAPSRAGGGGRTLSWRRAVPGRATPSFMTAPAAADAGRAGRAGRSLVPATTRTPEQLARVTLPGPPPRVRGRRQRRHAAGRRRRRPRLARRRSPSALAGRAPLAEVLDHAAARVPAGVDVARAQRASGLFCYAVLDRDARRPGSSPRLSAWAAERGWRSRCRAASSTGCRRR